MRSSSSLVDRTGGRASVALEGEGEDADRLRALRSQRRKRSKPEDWISGTFHQYDISGVVGAGTFGQVYKATRTKDGKLVALKCIKQEEGDGKGFPVTAVREMRILRQLKHKNIVDLIEVIIDGTPAPGRLSTVALVFEYLDHDLSGLLDTPEAANQITPALAKSYMMQLAAGVAYMHDKNIIHRDLKGANLLISNTGHLKIADWGLARRLYEMQDKYTTKVITLWYRPPELLLKSALYGPAVDLWSVGCIVAELLTRASAFPGKNESDQLSLIFDTVGTPTSQTWPGWKELPDADHWRETVRDSPRPSRMRERFLKYGDAALNLLEGLLALDPKRRVTARKALKHRYFQMKPLPSVPGMVTLNLHSCHEYEAKIRKKDNKKAGKGSYHSSAPSSKAKVSSGRKSTGGLGQHQHLQPQAAKQQSAQQRGRKRPGSQSRGHTRRAKMRFAWRSVALPLALLLPVVMTQAQTCSNDLDGYEASGVCCDVECGQCGGVGCSSVGPGGNSCCTANIKTSGIMCSESGAAPCIIDGDDPASPTPTTPTSPTPTTDDNTCSNGLPGYESSGVCCDLECGQCGGTGCSGLGPGGDSCCTKNIKNVGVGCSESGAAPCVIDGDVPTSPTPTTPTAPTPTTGDNTCSNGLPGYESSGVCCDLECGQCGGTGCSGLGPGGDSCCTKNIKNVGVGCSESGAAPCIIDGELPTVPSPTTPTTPTPTTGNTCSNGLAGYESSGVCCDQECGQCGGTGCSGLGPGGDSCCTKNIKDAGVGCSESGAAPCIIDGDLPTTPTPETCSNGIEGIDGNGVVCCSLSCGTCAGNGCSSRPGGSSGCCGGAIKGSGDLCSVTGTAPCIIDEDSVAPTPTAPTPTPPTPTPTPNASPTPVMTIPTDPSECDGTVPDFRYAASTGLVGKGRLYAESPGCFTMTDIYNWRGTESSGGVLSSKGPIYQLDDNGDVVDPVGEIGEPVTGKWLLTAELYVTDGAIFYCKGSSAGGDCDELRIQSTGSDDFYEVRGHGGSLYFENTVVTSWDTPNKEPQSEHEGGRSFLNCVSEKLTGETCEGAAKNEMGECRMDMINSEMGYMGFFDSESYGLTWKVRGFCQDLSNPDVFDTTNVYGDIIGCDIHHMYYGHYSYGQQGGVWTDNEMHDNIQYGFDPHDDSDYLTIARNKVYNNGNHGIIASKRCNNVEIYENEVSDGGAQAAGIFLHRSSNNAIVRDNTITNMQDAGIALLESFDAQIYGNTIDGAKYGIRMSLGSARNSVYENSFNACTDYGLYTYEGSDAPDVNGGRPYDNSFDNNKITDTAGGVKFKYSDDISVTNCEFTGTEELEFFDAQGTVWSGNSLPSGVCVDNISSDDGESVDESTFASSDGLPGSC
eukprot:g8536.t1